MRKIALLGILTSEKRIGVGALQVANSLSAIIDTPIGVPKLLIGAGAMTILAPCVLRGPAFVPIKMGLVATAYASHFAVRRVLLAVAFAALDGRIPAFLHANASSHRIGLSSIM